MNASLPRPQLRLHPRCASQHGNAMLITAAFIAALSAVLGITFTVTSTATQNTQRSDRYVAARVAAEGAVEYAYATWLNRIYGTPINTKDANKDLTPPPFDGVTYAKDGVQLRIDALNEYGVPVDTGALPPQVTGRVPGYQGWSGRTFTYAAQARVQIDDNTVLGVRRLFQYTEVPLFQSMFFFQDDLELYCPAPMVLNGLIHSNGTMYIAPLKSNPITIQGNATYAKEYSENDPPHVKTWSGYAKDRGTPPASWDKSKEAQLHKVPPIQPMGAAPEAVFKADTPNADGFWQLIAPADPNHDDPQAIKDRRLINKAGIVIEIKNTTLTETVVTTGTGKNQTKSVDTKVSIVTEIKEQNGTTITNQSEIKKALSKIVSRNQESIGGVTRAEMGIYDQREKKRIDTVQVDMATLKTALKDNTSNFNNVIYIHDTTPNTGTNTNPKAIRLINGSSLPDNGLTIASQNPVYVQGDYNTGGTGTTVPSNSTPTLKDVKPTAGDYNRVPAAIIADAVMLLSNNWKDSNSSLDISKRTASNTTYNTAILAGFMPTTAEKYSGGANNFTRFLENWSNKYCTYYGSMVQLFPSRVFTGLWETGQIFSPPTRLWSFDTRYLTKPPPGSVEAIVLSRGPWSTF